MAFRFLNRASGLAAAAFLCFCCASCLKVSYGVGENLIPDSQLYDIYSAEFPLTDIEMKMLDSLSGYSSKRITIGAIRDEEFGLTTRGCALSLVPIVHNISFGSNPEFRYFHLSAAHDTINVADSRETNILQNINVYELSEPMDFGRVDMNTPVEHGTKRITEGIPVYNGKDSLSFDFSRDFGEKYMNMVSSDLKDMDTYLKKFPGIYIDTDEPDGIGGRINMFQLQLGVNTSYGYLTKDYAELAFSAEFDGVRKDTSFLFCLSPTYMFSVDSLINIQQQQGYTTYTFPLYCLNTTSHETREREGKVSDKISIEGGGGLKAVFSAQEIIDKTKDEIGRNGDPDKAVIARATLVLPFEFPDDYKTMCQYPDYISPTCRIGSSDSEGNHYVSFASLTDVSNKQEDPGTLNRSLLQYAPDITYHVQQLISMPESVNISNYDIWTLLMSKESERVDTDEQENSYNEYMNALMMQQYMSNLYGYGGYGGYGYGGYGYGYGGYGYGGYGGYGYDPYGYGYGGYGYNNYYSLMLASQYASMSSSSSTKTSVEMDKDRYFKAVLNGPDAENGRVPVLKITYALPKDR